MKNSKSLTLFFTHDVSLKIWKERGLFDREVRPYLYFAKHLGWDIQFFTYGSNEDLEYAEELFPIKIIPAYLGMKKPKQKLVRLLISPFLILKHHKELKKQSIYKSNQFWGSWNIILAKFLWGGKALGRCGYELLTFTINEKKSLPRLCFVWAISYFTYKFSDMVLVATEADKLSATKRFSFLKDKTLIVESNWIDTDIFVDQSNKKKHIDIGFIGRFNPQKNLELLIAAAKIVKCTLNLCGSGEEKSKLEKLCTDRRFTISDPLENRDVPNLLNQFKIFVLPSHYEGNPKALLEAMSCKCAVIATDVPGSREIITNGENGILCESTAESLATCISTLLDDPKLRTQIGENAGKYVRKNNSLNSYLEREQKRLEKLII